MDTFRVQRMNCSCNRLRAEWFPLSQSPEYSDTLFELIHFGNFLQGVVQSISLYVSEKPLACYPYTASHRFIQHRTVESATLIEAGMRASISVPSSACRFANMALNPCSSSLFTKAAMVDFFRLLSFSSSRILVLKTDIA